MNKLFVLVLALAFAGCGRPGHHGGSINGADSSSGRIDGGGPPEPSNAGTTVGQGTTPNGTTGSGTGTGQGGTTAGNPGFVQVDGVSMDPAAFLKALGLSFHDGVGVFSPACGALKVSAGRIDLVTGRLEIKVTGFDTDPRSGFCTVADYQFSKNAKFTLAKSPTAPSVAVTNDHGAYSTTGQIQFTVSGRGVAGTDDKTKKPNITLTIDFRDALSRLRSVAPASKTIAQQISEAIGGPNGDAVYNTIP